MDNPNYQNYSLEELYDALEHVNEEEYPERTEIIRRCITEKERGRDASKGTSQEQNNAYVMTKARTFEFHGNWQEYFKIWIVNVGLSIITLGIYSAWAKVRSKKYFYGNTLLDGSAFEYLAKPVAILKGRIIAVIFLIGYLSVDYFYPLYSWIFVVALPALPLLITRSLKFRLRNTMYRNVRFNYHGKYADALMAWTALPVLLPFTLFLLYPYIVLKRKMLFINFSSFGATRFKLNAISGDFYSVYFRAGGIYFLSAIISGFLSSAFVWLGVVAIAFGYLYMTASIHAGINNIVINGTTLDSHRFESNMYGDELFGIYVMNLIAIVSTLGLATPWAMVRVAKYRASCTKMYVHGDLSHYIDQALDDDQAFGEEIGEVFDMEIAL